MLIIWCLLGRCTNTSGYLANAEIREIITLGQSAVDPDEYGISLSQSFYDKTTDSDIVVYDNDQWVSWMSESTKQGRVKWIKDLQLGGVSDWSLDLQRDYWGDTWMLDGNYTNHNDPEDTQLCSLDPEYSTLDDLSKNSENMSSRCKAIHVVQVLGKLLDAAMANFTDVNNGYDGKFKAYVRSVKEMAPKQLNEFMDTKGPANNFMTCDLSGYDQYHGK